MHRAPEPRTAQPEAHDKSPAHRAREVELKLKLRARDLAALRVRLDRLGVSRIEQIDNVYYDTPDQRLAACKAALRLRCIRQGRRRRWVQTFKTEDAESALSVRGEWEAAAPGGRMDPSLLAHSPLERTLGGSGSGSGSGGAGAAQLAALRPLFRTVFERTTWDLALPGAHVEAVIDVGEIQAQGSTEPICEAELELRSGSQAALLDLALELAGASGRRRADLNLLPYGASKAARGYRLALGRRPTPYAASAASLAALFSPKQRVAAAARQWVGAGMNNLLANAVELVDSDDPEFVHQARVALRRVRAGLDLLGTGAELPRRLKDALHSWADRFGATRDWDVLCGQLLPSMARAWARRLPAREQRAWERIRQAAARRQARARARLRRQLEGPQFAEFALRMLRWSAGTPTAPGRYVAALVPKEVKARQRALARSGRSFARLSVARQHKVRIQAKSLRYVIEMFQGFLPKSMGRKYLRALTRFQDAAGALRDAIVAHDCIGPLARSAAIQDQLAAWVRARQEEETIRAQRLAAAL